MIECDNRKKKLFLLHRKDILINKRNEMYEEAIQRRMEHERKSDWVKYILTVQMMKHIFTLFDQRREVVTRQAKVQFAVNMFAIKFRLWS